MKNPPTIEEIAREANGEELHEAFMDEGLYGLLPSMLGDACRVFERIQDREVFLMGALPVCSTLMRGAHTMTNRGPQGLNLAVWIYAPYGAGKGMASMADILLESVREEAQQRQDEANALHAHAVDVYNSESKLAKKALNEMVSRERDAREALKPLRKIAEPSRTADQAKQVADLENVIRDCTEKPTLPTLPPPPPREDITLPLYGNVKTIRDYIEANEGHVLFFDSEADSLHMQSGEYGNLGIIFKQGIENEKSGQIFKTTGNKSWTSYISIMIAATDDQLIKFIKGPTDGLFSRFLYYGFEGDNGWLSQRPTKAKNYQSQLLGFSPRYASLYEAVREFQPTVTFTEGQWDNHDRLYQKKKIAAVKTHTALGGSINRLGKFQLRLASTLAIMRHHEAGTMAEELECDRDSWSAAELIIYRFERGLFETWDLYNVEQLPTDNEGRNADHDIAKIAAAKEALRLQEERGLALAQIHDTLIFDERFRAFTSNWSVIVNNSARKNRVRRLLTYRQR